MDDWTKELPAKQGAAVRTLVSMQSRESIFGQANRFDGAVVGRTTGWLRAHPCPDLLSSRTTLRGFISSIPQRFNPRLFKPEVAVKGEISSWVQRAAGLESSGAAARSAGDERAAESHFREALDLAVKAVNRIAETSSDSTRLDVLHIAARLALDVGEVSQARRLMEEAFEADASVAGSEEWERLRNVADWPDEWLVAAGRRDPPDTAALDALAERYWKPLFGRCYLLTLDRDKASDLAQQAWCRVLRARQRLNPSGNFPAYLATVATNLWRDSLRSARRAGPMSDDRLASLDQAFTLDDDDSIVLGDLLPDLNSLQADKQRALKLDIDRALGRLTPHLRDVLVARFITGESCAEIGSRHGRTEQTVSGWVRDAIREIKLHLEDPAHRVVRTNEP